VVVVVVAASEERDKARNFHYRVDNEINHTERRRRGEKGNIPPAIASKKNNEADLQTALAEGTERNETEWMNG
jgi:hypothetical protein